jgi:hypothetical protein
MLQIIIAGYKNMREKERERNSTNLRKRSMNYAFLLLGSSYDQCPISLIGSLTCIIPSLNKIGHLREVQMEISNCC